MPSELGPTPITATHRLAYLISVPGLRPHAVRYYVDATPSADPDGYNFVAFGGGARSMSDAVNDILTIVKPMYNNAVSIGNFVLQQYAAGAWIPVASDANTASGTSGNTTVPAQQLTFSLRTATGKPMRSIVLETGYPAYFGKFLTMTALGGAWGAYGSSLVNHGVNNLGFFVRSRGAEFAASVISAVFDLNDRLKRDRGGE